MLRPRPLHANRGLQLHHSLSKQPNKQKQPPPPPLRAAHSDSLEFPISFFWSGRPKVERHDVGVALAIRDDIVKQLPCLSQRIND
nr:unnamed protein product [Spirometra erinaceieuropaei]